MNVLIVQSIGFVAVGFSILTYQLNKRPQMLTADATAAFFYSLHFFLLAAPTGGILNLIGGARALTFYRYPPTKNNWPLLVLFMGITCIATVLFWQGWISILPLAGTTSYAIAFWQTDTKLIRRFLLASFPLWFVYNLVVGSYPGMLIEIILLIANLVGQYRFDFRSKVKSSNLVH